MSVPEDVETRPLDAPGWYPYGAAATLARWDGDVWSGERARAPEIGAPPAWRRRRHRPGLWLWCLLVGQLWTVAAAALSVHFHSTVWSWTSLGGYVVFTYGAVLMVDTYVHFRALPQWRACAFVGAVAGLVAIGAAYALEVWCEHHLGLRGTLWLTGPIEESAKLAVPLGLLVFGGRRYRDPRAGLAMVLVSGSVFGAVEGAKWQSDTSYQWTHLLYALVRPSAELFHPFVTGVAAVVIWMAARRAGRVVTAAGLKAYAMVVIVHSVHDGLATLSPTPRGQHFGVVQPTRDLSQALGQGAYVGVVAFLFSLALFQLLRHSARELVAPGTLSKTPPRWRPRIKQWGARKWTTPRGANGEEQHE